MKSQNSHHGEMKLQEKDEETERDSEGQWKFSFVCEKVDEHFVSLLQKFCKKERKNWCDGEIFFLSLPFIFLFFSL